jgi:hypothetical protein
VLGPAFALGVIYDAMSSPRPSVFDTCLQGLSNKSPQEVHRTQETLRTVMHTIYSMLHTISMNFLKGQVLHPASLSSAEPGIIDTAAGIRLGYNGRLSDDHSNAARGAGTCEGVPKRKRQDRLARYDGQSMHASLLQDMVSQPAAPWASSGR